MNNVRFKDLGCIPYKEAWNLQERILEMVVSERNASASGNKWNTSQTLIFCEHPHVFTLGKSGKRNNLLINRELLDRIGAEYYEIDRGGDITYHGPGQLVGYPIFDLESMKTGVKEYIRRIEQAVINFLQSYGIAAGRMEKATGVWLGTASRQKARKICAIGVRVSRHVTMHGFALNINTDLEYFRCINPCGFTDREVTSLQQETGDVIEMTLVKQKLLKNLSGVFGIRWID